MKAALVAASLVFAALSAPEVHAQAKDWPSYNRNLNSDRYATISDIDYKNVNTLKVLCSFDTGDQDSFETGLLMVDGSLYGTTEHDTFSLDPNSCKLNWRTHEDFPAGDLKVNRGVAWLDKRLFRGTTDGNVIAYDARTGKKLWSTPIADAKKGESVPAAPIAWNGMVYIGNAGSENTGVKGRMYALDATSGKIAWEAFLVPKAAGDTARGPAAPGPKDAKAGGAPVTGGASWTSYSLDQRAGMLYIPGGNPAPQGAFMNSVVVLDAKTGAYQKHFPLVKRDDRDWDVSTAPVLFPNRKGVHVLAEAPKDGNLYLVNTTSGQVVYKKPVTQIVNQGARFCPGAQGGSEWNGAAFDPAENLLLTGSVHWCSTLRAGKRAAGEEATKMDDPKTWAGFLTATDADTGVRKWQFKAPAPIVSGVTPTSGRLVLFGDLAGTFYALDTAKGTKVFSKDLGGAIGGGVIAYDTNMGEKFAVAVGMVSPLWSTPKTTNKVVVLGLK